MKALFEVKYLGVEWYDKDTVLRVQESFIPVKVEYEETLEQFVCQTVIYHKAQDVQHGLLAFRFTGKNDSEPYFELGDGNLAPLQKVIDTDSNKIWWVKADTWLKDKKRWAARMYRTAGIVTAVLGNQKCQIQIGSSDFSSEQLNRYLADFKSDLWELILDESSYVRGEAKKTHDGGVNEESIQLISNLLTHAQNILNNPKSELREVQALKPRKLVKPVNRTFMELATKGGGKYLTSRATQPSYNVPENRYVLFALMRVYKIVKQLVMISKSKVDRFESTVTKLNDRLGAFSDVKNINIDLVRKDLERLKLRYDVEHLSREANDKLQEHINKQKDDFPNNSSQQIWYVKIGKPTQNSNSFFAGIKNNRNDPWFETESGRQLVFFTYSDAFYDELFEQNIEYEVCGNRFREDGVRASGGLWYRYTLRNLTSIKVIGGEGLSKRHEKFMSERAKAIALDNNGWIKKLDRRELQEQEKEKAAIKSRISFYESTQEKVKQVYAQLEPKLSKFKRLLLELGMLEIKPSSTFPNSMTFVQNPDYQAIHTGYKKIREYTHLTDEDLLLSLEKVEEIGLINMPILYERWCLLQIIKVLIQNYHYSPSGNWKRKLINIIETRKHSESLSFSNVYLKRKVQLRYEPMLENGRTPDFVLDVKSEYKNGNSSERRFVMDAKFYSSEILRMNDGIGGIVHQLYHEKDYSEGGKNAVFVLHPVKGAIEEIVSPQAWGKYSYLGELAMFEWDKGARTSFHQYGAICASPVLKLSYLDEFQRLIGMFLQYGVENNKHSSSPDDDVESINFCIACGSHDLRFVEKNTDNGRSKWYECNHCRHFTTYNHCFSCNTRLIKNGDYWTYHSQMPMEPLNIKCPSCESLL